MKNLLSNYSQWTKFVIIHLLFMGFMHHLSFGQSHISVSAGPDFGTVQFLADGKINPFYNKDGFKVGVALPVSVTINATYDPFTSYMTSEPEEMNFNGIITLAGGGYASYSIQEDFKISGALGYGVTANSEPFGISFGDKEFADYLAYSLYFDIAGKYKQFGLKFTTQSDLLQVFATYNVSEKFFVGLGYRRLNRIILISDSAASSPSGLQATLGFNWSK